MALRKPCIKSTTATIVHNREKSYFSHADARNQDVHRLNTDHYAEKSRENARLASTLRSVEAFESFTGRASSHGEAVMDHDELLKLADKIERCHTEFKAYRCDADGLTYNAHPINSCTTRLCKHCAEIRASRWIKDTYAKLAAYIEDTEVEPCFVTLTFFDDQLRHLLYGSVLDYAKAAMAKLRKKPEWKRAVDSAIYCFEVTWSMERQQWHPHVHVLLLLKPREWIGKDRLTRAWMDVGGGVKVDVKPVKSLNDGLARVLRYVTKACDTTTMPADRVIELLTQMEGAHLIQSCGPFRKYKVPTVRDFTNEIKLLAFQMGWSNTYPIEALPKDRRACPCCGRLGREVSLTAQELTLQPIYQVLDRPLHVQSTKLRDRPIDHF